MSAVINTDSGTIEPLVIDGYQATRESANVVHRIIGRSDPDVTFRPAILRRGTLAMVFDDEALALAAVEAHATEDVFELVDAERTSVEMSYVVDGNISRTLDPETRDVWVVEVDYQEVSP